MIARQDVLVKRNCSKQAIGDMVIRREVFFRHRVSVSASLCLWTVPFTSVSHISLPHLDGTGQQE